MFRRHIRPWPYFGGLALACLGLQAVTGILMALFYQPAPEYAYTSVYYISNVVPYGWLVLTIHTWGATLTIIFSALHAIRMLITATYKHPREVVWVLGALTFPLTIVLGVTGYLLPWSQEAYSSTVAAISLIAQTPIAGGWIANALLNGDALSATTLKRFYTAHVMLLPAVLSGLIVAHIWVSHRVATADDEETIPLYPDLFISAATALALLLSIFAVLAILLPASLGTKADPSLAASTSKPMWFLLGPHVLSQYLPAALIMGVLLLLGLLFILLPYLDRALTRRSD